LNVESYGGEKNYVPGFYALIMLMLRRSVRSPVRYWTNESSRF